MTTLFTPGRIGGVEIRNRVVMPSMTTRLADTEGYATDSSIAYFAARAAGAVGLVTVEMASPERVGRHRARELGIYDDRFLPGLKRLTAVLHDHGAKASIQLGHGGGHTRKDICGEQPIAPSAIPHYVFEVTGETIVPLEMTRERIAQTVEAFVDAAARARAAGFDCVEVHGAHGYLLSQFLCPEENRRTDEYGGSLENRARISLEIVQRIKAAQPGLPVIFRMSADDFFPTGLQFVEALQVAKMAAAVGADAIHVAGGHYRSLPSGERVVPPMIYPEATFLDYAAQIKKELAVPVISVGRLGNPAIAKMAVESGKADFIALGRSLIADPDWVNKVSRDQPVRRCLACNVCINEMRGGSQLTCLVNPAAAHELEFAAKNIAPKNERIAVIGAGPAGLSYALLVAADNRVTVIERAAKPGGAFRYAGQGPLFQEVIARQESLDIYIDELAKACATAGVTFKYGIDAARNPEILKPFDRIVIATGARYRYGLGSVVPHLLNAGFGKSWLARRLFKSAPLRDWFYYRARKSTGSVFKPLTAASQKVDVIGDAAQAGKGKAAIASAYQAAFSAGRRPV
jgi:2,4-dienoyl-CoA reductase-like NADH-dependent reductase (Old Yellow Enzyme family)